MGFYTKILRSMLFHLDPEIAHAIGKLALRQTWLWKAGSITTDRQDTRLGIQTGDLEFPSPIGLAAGLDKDCEFLDSLLSLGFGYVVGGTVTLNPRPGNPRPRVSRIVKENALVNAYGFPSKGSARVQNNLQRLRAQNNKHGKPVLVNVSGLTVEEFQACHAAVEPWSDAVELNISSPNTEGIKVFQEPETFRTLLQHVNIKRRKPIFVKIPPYTSSDQQERILNLVRIAKELGVEGITAANTRPVVASELSTNSGGLSGSPLLEDMLRIVSDVRVEVGQGMIINASGGISSADDVLRALKAGANTAQIYTSLIYCGPRVAKNINTGLLAHVQEQGVSSLVDLLPWLHRKG
ncbi:dihydroorotate dehydrogenase (quinone) [Dehalococcoidia bacterium]|nr:dihydroorotate dehydrogenase (quinone) [Dehalococcoidia bacterium]